MLEIGSAKVPLCGGVSRRGVHASRLVDARRCIIGQLVETRSGRGRHPPKSPKIKNCITLFLVGSPGHLDTWDMKPDAPEDIRGAFKPISTSVPGVQICEHFPLMARMMDKVALVRSLHHATGASHENGQRWMMSGHDFNAANPQPFIGSVISRVLRPARQSAGEHPAAGEDRQHRHRHAARPRRRLPRQRSRAVRPQRRSGPARLRGEEPRTARRANRVPHRGAPQAARSNSTTCSGEPKRRRPLERDTAYARAFNLLTSPETKKAFDLTQETDKLRDRYGRNTFGQSCLMARRLIENGTRFVTVNHFDTVFGITCWDMHANGGNLDNTYADYERHLCPQFDLALTALVEDLEQRGMLEETVIAVFSEFGRTPKINNQGRPRPLSVGLDELLRRRRHLAAARSSARPTRSAPRRTIGPSRRRKCWPRSTRRWASTWKRP